MQIGRYLALVLPFVISGNAQAVCPQHAVGGALWARMDQSVLPLFNETLLNSMPATFPIPSDPITVFTCPDGFDDTIMTPDHGTLSVHYHSFSVELGYGGIITDAVVDIQASTNLTMQLCAMPDAYCSASLNAANVSIHGRLVPRVDGCSLAYELYDAYISIPPEATQISLDACGLYGAAWQTLYDLFRDTIVTTAQTSIEEGVREALPGLLAMFTSELFAQGVDAAGVTVDVGVESIDVEPSGMTVGLRAGAHPTGAVAACLPPASAMAAPVDEPSAAALGNGMIAIGVSRRFAEQVLQAAWLAGWLCFDTADYGLALGQYLDPILPGAIVEGGVVATQPPQLRFRGDEAQRTIAAVLPAVAAEVRLGFSPDTLNVISTTLAAALIGDLTIDQRTKSLVITPTSIESSTINVNLQGGSLSFSAQAIQNIITGMLLPAFLENIGPLPVTSAIFPFAPLAFFVDDVSVSATHLYADLSLWPIRASDTTAPHTMLAGEVPAVVPPHVTLTFASIDNDTPTEFMRYKIWIDGLSLAQLMTGTDVRLGPLTDGLHALDLQAIDLNDNADPHKLRLNVVVDATPPTVTAIDPPLGFINASSVAVQYVISDDRTPDAALRRSFSVVFSDPNGANAPAPRQGTLDAAGLLQLDELPEDMIATLTVTAVDAVGNEGTAVLSFGIDANPSFSCASARGSGPGISAALLIGLFLLARRGLRR
jgi:hypothetical protein